MADKDEDVKPEGTPLPTGEISDWGNDVKIVEPKVFGSAGEERKEETEEVEEVVEEQPEEQPVVEETQVEVDDPGEFEPKDYAFEVVIYNEKGQNGKTIKVKSLEQWDELIEKESNLGSATALLKAERAANRMQLNMERDKADYDVKKAQYDDAVKNQEERTDNLDRLTNEMLYLEERGDLPKIPVKYRDDWTSDEAKKDPAVKEQKALLDFMAKENNSRKKAGLKAMDSLLDAYNAFQLDQRKKGEETSRKTAAQQRKELGAKVAGSSPAPVGTAPKGISVGRVGRLEDLGAGW